MTAVDQSLDLTALAHGRDAASRETLLMAVVDLCEDAQTTRPAQIASAQPVLGELFMSLVAQAERDVRRRLAERIAEASWAPPLLIDALVFDEIEIARPVIAGSPLLHDADLIRILHQAGLDHQIEVARRPSIGAAVVDAILDGHDATVMTALAGNDTADIQSGAMARLIEEARKAPSLRSPLARHPRLTPDLAEKLYVWVGESLKTAIASRFRIDPAALEAAMAQSVRELAAAAPASSVKDREAMEARLVDKLHEAGQLRSGYLLRALREGKLSLFVAALVKLSGLTRLQVETAMGGDRPEHLALASLAGGIDRSVFPTILSLVRQLNGGMPSGGAESMVRAADMFETYSAANAAAVLSEALD